MNQQQLHAPILVFSYGNPSRGDDALGPQMYDMLQHYLIDTGQNNAVDLLTDFQLQIEHAIDLENRQAVIFIDADMSCQSPYEFYRLKANRDNSYTSHAMSPAALISVYQQLNSQQTPDTYMLTIRGYEFGLGQEITSQALNNLQQSFEFVKQLLIMNPEYWRDECVVY